MSPRQLTFIDATSTVKLGASRGPLSEDIALGSWMDISSDTRPSGRGSSSCTRVSAALRKIHTLTSTETRAVALANTRRHIAIRRSTSRLWWPARTTTMTSL
jgi:hypothetical protein